MFLLKDLHLPSLCCIIQSPFETILSIIIIPWGKELGTDRAHQSNHPRLTLSFRRTFFCIKISCCMSHVERERKKQNKQRKKKRGCPRWGSNSRHPHCSDTVYKYGALVQLSYGGLLKRRKKWILILFKIFQQSKKWRASIMFSHSSSKSTLLLIFTM